MIIGNIISASANKDKICIGLSLVRIHSIRGRCGSYIGPESSVCERTDGPRCIVVRSRPVRIRGAHGFPSFPPLLTREWVVNTTKNFLYCFVICIRKFFCELARSCWSHKRCQQKKWTASQKLPTMLANPNKAWRVGHFDLTNESDSWAPHLRTDQYSHFVRNNWHSSPQIHSDKWGSPALCESTKFLHAPEIKKIWEGRKGKRGQRTN